MLRRFLFATVFALTACATSPEKPAEVDAAAAAQATDTCLSNPALAEQWGECNVKHTIYGSRAAIAACQAKFAKASKTGGVLMMKIRIKPDGFVKEVAADDSVYPANKKLEACLAREIGKLRFAKPPKGVKPVVYYPYQF